MIIWLYRLAFVPVFVCLFPFYLPKIIRRGGYLEKIKQLINEKRVIYDHNVDQKQYKWSGKVKLKKIETNLLPKYIQSNLEKYKDWID